MMNKKTAYFVTTGLLGLALLPGAVMDIAQPQMVVDAANTLQIPLHMLTLIGVWKLVGVFALARPAFERINEWAYAGFFFDLTGAAFLHGAVGDTAGIFPPLVILGLLVASYRLRNASREEAGAGAPSAQPIDAVKTA